MATFSDLDEWFSPGLTLTVLGREYVVPLASGELGLWCRRTAEVAGAITTASSDAEVEAAVAGAHALPDPPGARQLTLHERVLGEDLYRQMLADGVPDPYIKMCGETAYVWIVGGEEPAERYWRSGGRPELLARENRATRRASQRNGGAAASGTQKPASTSGTKSRRRRNPGSR